METTTSEIAIERNYDNRDKGDRVIVIEHFHGEIPRRNRFACICVSRRRARRDGTKGIIGGQRRMAPRSSDS